MLVDAKTGKPINGTYNGPAMAPPPGMSPEDFARAAAAHKLDPYKKPPAALADTRSNAEKWYEAHIAPILNKGVTGAANEVLGGNLSKTNPLNLTSSLNPATVAKYVAPQTIPQAALDALNMIPGFGELGLLTRLAGATGVGAIAGKVSGEGGKKGAIGGLVGQGMGEAFGLLGKKKFRSSMQHGDFGGAVGDILGFPEIKAAMKRGRNVVELIREGKVADAIGYRTDKTLKQVGKALANEQFTVPSTTVGGKDRVLKGWGAAQNELKRLGKLAFGPIESKDTAAAAVAQASRQKLMEQITGKLDNIDTDLADQFRLNNELWNKYYAINDIVTNAEMRPEGGQFQAAAGQRRLAEKAQPTRAKLGDTDYEKLQKGLFGGASQHAGFDIPIKKGQGQRVILSPYGPRTYGTLPQGGKTIGRAPVPTKILRALGVKPGSDTAEYLEKQYSEQGVPF